MPNKPFTYSAEELYVWLSAKPSFVLLDVRNQAEFAHWSIEGPHACPYINIPYFNFIADATESIAAIPPKEKIRVVCSHEGSAKYVADLLIENGYSDVGYLQQGIVGWGNALIPHRVTPRDSPYHVYQCIRPGKASISYILCSHGEAHVFDPSRNIEVYLRLAKKERCKITTTFETHRQADYISGCQLLQKKAQATIRASKMDFDGAGFDYSSVGDGHTFNCGGIAVQAFHTPGHTTGSLSYVIDERYLISGDTIFIGSIGRPDLGGQWEKWSRTLYLTLMLKYRDLSDDLLVLPAHFSSWQEANKELLFCDSLGHLKEKLEAFSIVNELRFKEFIRNNMRPQPSVYGEIRKVNAGWLSPSEKEADVMDLGKNECSASNYGQVGVSAESLRQEQNDNQGE